MTPAIHMGRRQRIGLYREFRFLNMNFVSVTQCVHFVYAKYQACIKSFVAIIRKFDFVIVKCIGFWFVGIAGKEI